MLKNHIHRLTHFYYSGIILIRLLGSCSTPSINSSTQITEPGIVMEKCLLSAPGTSIRLEAMCSKLAVYEDRSTQSGRQIELNIAVIPAISRNPAPDPLFFIPGGPGEAATESYLPLANAFSRINQKRDIVLVDQRGTGKSHPLNCDTSIEDPSTTMPDEQILTDSLRACLEELDANPEFYNTSIAMDDLDEVREALGYEIINLYGASYGTRAALVYLRQHPDRVRTAILDGAAPPNWTLGPTIASDGQRALDLLFSRCASDEVCHKSFPDLPTEFQWLLNGLSQEPVEVSLNDPIDGRPTTFSLTRERFTNTIHFMSYTPEMVALLPLLIHTAYTQDDYSRVVAQALSTSALLDQSIAPGMRFSVICAEDVPFYNHQNKTQGYLGEFITETFTSVCKTWPRGEIPVDFKEAVRSDAPVLILSGGSDPVTPPTNGELTAQSLPNSLHIIIPEMGHINIFRGCIPRIATTFVEDGSISGVKEETCSQNILPMPFFINFSGPTP